MKIENITDLKKFKEKLNFWLNSKLSEFDSNLYVLFFSYGSKSARCKVWSTSDNEKKVVIKRLINFIEKQYGKNRGLPEFLKIDIAINIEEKKWQEVVAEVEGQKHNNHYRKGISFNENFGISFLEQEIYGKAIIRGVVYNEPNFFDYKNLNDAIQKKYTSLKTDYNSKNINKVWIFDTISVFYEDENFIDLQSEGQQNGVRVVTENNKEHIEKIIKKNANFLHGEILETGRFKYGYFPAFDREIKSYNTVRHCTAVYALLETLEVDYNENYLPKIKNAIDYALDVFYKELNNAAYMIDGEDDSNYEIKLGSLAAAIFMLAKYQEITKDNKYQKYAENLANGIKNMVDERGETTHILNYPDLNLKEKFRIIYYDGEAALGLLRLYQINHDENLLETVKLMFEHFINKNYDKYHDHWLSYCTNELTKICPEQKYFEFGLNNYVRHMKFIGQRRTAYATFLEMMMAAYKMVSRIKENRMQDLLELAKFEELKALIQQRVEFQRSTGFFYPEVAMYMAKPERVLNSFYVRHDRFRTRIDDQEHNLSGFVAYINYFEN